MAKLISINKPTPDAYKGWTFTLVGGLVLGIGAIILGGDDAADTAAAGDCRFVVTVDDLNVREAADLDAAPIGAQLDTGDEVVGTPVVENGFRRLADGRWVSDDLLRPLPGTDCG